MIHVRVVSDYACPWCYLGHARLRRVLGDRPARVEIVHFPLAPDTPKEGRAVRPYLAAKGIDVDEAMIAMTVRLEDEGLPYHGDPDTMRTWNTRRAQELAAWAVTQPGGDAIHDALFTAYQVDNVDISDDDVLVGIAGSIGLDPGAARAALVAGEGAATVASDHAWAHGVGITAVPTFVVGDRGVVGAQPAHVLEQLLASAET